MDRELSVMSGSFNDSVTVCNRSGCRANPRFVNPSPCSVVAKSFTVVVLLVAPFRDHLAAEVLKRFGSLTI